MKKYNTTSSKIFDLKSIDFGVKDSKGRETGLRFQINKVEVRELTEEETQGCYSCLELDFIPTDGIIYDVMPSKTRDGENFGRLQSVYVPNLEESTKFISKILKRHKK